MGNYDKACNNVGAVRFVQEHMKVCEIIAKELDVPVENILVLLLPKVNMVQVVLPGNIIITFLSRLLHHFSQVGFIQRIVTKLGWLFFLRFQFVRDLLLSSMVTLFGGKKMLWPSLKLW